MRRGRLTLSTLLVAITAAAAVCVPLATAQTTAGPSPNGVYANGISSGVGKTSVTIDVNASGTAVTATIMCYEKHGVYVQADIGAATYRLRNGAFSVNRTYETDKYVPQNGESIQETGRGEVLFTGTFTGSAFVGRVQIGFGARRALHFGGGCRKSSYVATLEPAG